jgi:hypothetical protein
MYSAPDGMGEEGVGRKGGEGEEGDEGEEGEEGEVVEGE